MTFPPCRSLLPGFPAAVALIGLVGVLLVPRLAIADPGTAHSPRAPLQSLDGTWQIAPDPGDRGRAEQWFLPQRFPAERSRAIPVPGNINEAWPNPAPIADGHNLDWYERTFTADALAAPGLRRYLRFGAVRETSEVWLNGISLGKHDGGEDPFEFDVTSLLRAGRRNTLIIRVASPFFGGITQHVQLAQEPAVRLLDAFAQPSAERREIRLDVTLENNGAAPATVEVLAQWGEFRPRRDLGSRSVRVTVPAGQTVATLVLPVAQVHPWSPDQPFLYTLKVASQWREAPSAAGGRDACSFRTGFRDFRIVGDFFTLNGKRLFLKSTHGNWYDPVVIEATPRTMTYLDKDFTQLKKAGFNTLRLILSSGLPEQLDRADEEGLLVYSEHETSWQLKDPRRFGITLNQVVRRDRNHPSLAIWGLLNETASQEIFQRARAWLPSLRAIDATRLVLLSSGRWDGNFTTGSASNPGSRTWDVLMGGEDPHHPQPTGPLPEDGGAFHSGTGDAHIYQEYPTSWGFVTHFSQLAERTRPFFLSEAGDGSSYDPLNEGRELEKAHAPATAFAWGWVHPAEQGLKQTWRTYGLDQTYPCIDAMLIDSALDQSRQRALTFSIVRSNPRVNGYNLTSLNDCWGTGEGFLDNFREFKPGHLAVLQAGWAPLRWCLLVNPRHVYAGQPLRVRVALANEDQLPPGTYPAVLTLAGPGGTFWRKTVTVQVPAGAAAPMACAVADEDIPIPATASGTYELRAELTGRANAAANVQQFTVSPPLAPPSLGEVTLLGATPDVRNFLQRYGARPRDYVAGETHDREVILVGPGLHGNAAAWSQLYARCAQGAHLIFLSPQVFLRDAQAKAAPPRWLALAEKGTLVNETEWLYHKDVVAKKGPLWAGLPTRLMTPEYYGEMLRQAPYFRGIATPDETAAVAIRCVADGAAPMDYKDGVMLGTYRFHAGHFTINGLSILGHLGTPAADRLLVNLLAAGARDAAAVQPIPDGFASELASLGLQD